MKKKSFQQTENNERNPYSKKIAKILHILERIKFSSLNWVRFFIVPKERIIVRFSGNIIYISPLLHTFHRPPFLLASLVRFMF